MSTMHFQVFEWY